jgi:hypothetical protein
VNPEPNTSDDDHAEEILLEKRDSVCVFKNNYFEELKKDNASFLSSSKSKFGSSIFFDTSQKTRKRSQS